MMWLSIIEVVPSADSAPMRNCPMSINNHLLNFLIRHKGTGGTPLLTTFELVVAMDHHWEWGPMVFTGGTLAVAVSD